MYNLFMRSRANIFPFLIPYLAIFIGLNFLKNAWIAILLYHSLILAYLIITGHLADFRKILTGWNIRLFLISCAISVIGGPALFLLWNFMKLDISSLSSNLAEFQLKGLSWILFIPYFCLLHPILEELFWRSKSNGASGSEYIKDILFGGYHILVLVLFIKPEWVIISFFILAFVSWMWRVISYKTDGLLIAFLSHILANSSIIIAVNFILSQDRVN
jgi:membrane protease YdiL (CAAX protease family)